MCESEHIWLVVINTRAPRGGEDGNMGCLVKGFCAIPVPPPVTRATSPFAEKRVSLFKVGSAIVGDGFLCRYTEGFVLLHFGETGERERLNKDKFIYIRQQHYRAPPEFIYSSGMVSYRFDQSVRS